MTAALALQNGLQILKHQSSGFIGITCIQACHYSSDVEYRLSSLKRGTGGRSSFSGIVATVFGASGFLGRYVCNKLGKIGTQLIIPYRGDGYEVLRLRLCGDLGQTLFHQIDPKDEESIAKAVKYSNVVINLIGRDWETKNYKFDDVHVKTARTIARISREAGIQKFIHLSALNACEKPEPKLLKNGSGFLASKWRGEQAVLEEFPDAIIFRPADIYGQEDRFLRPYGNHWRHQIGFLPIWKKGECTIKQPVYCQDVAQGIINACKDPDANGKIFQAVGPKRYLLADLVDWFHRIMRREHSYYRYDLRWDPFFQMRISFTEKLPGTPIASLHWERFEREAVSDTVESGVPTLEDLGVNLTCMEDQVPWELKPFLARAYYDEELGEFEKPLPPQPIA